MSKVAEKIECQKTEDILNHSCGTSVLKTTEKNLWRSSIFSKVF